MDGDLPSESAEVRKRTAQQDLERSKKPQVPRFTQGEEGSLRRGGKKYLNFLKIRSNFKLLFSSLSLFFIWKTKNFLRRNQLSKLQYNRLDHGSRILFSSLFKIIK